MVHTKLFLVRNHSYVLIDCNWRSRCIDGIVGNACYPLDGRQNKFQRSAATGVDDCDLGLIQQALTGPTSITFACGTVTTVIMMVVVRAAPMSMPGGGWVTFATFIAVLSAIVICLLTTES